MLFWVKKMRNNNRLRKYVPSLLLFLLFETVAVALWLAKGNLFYLLNFSYIGGCLGVGTALFAAGKRYARQFVQWAVGSYMLLYLGVLSHENMQIEGFWYYLFLGVFEAATIHYAVAKIFGPLVFGRGWCGYACWTAMVLDLLPYKKTQAPRKKLGFLRYVTFTASFVYVAALFLMHAEHMEEILFVSFLVGNILYYVVGIALAFRCKDNRAFCKYLCPVTVFFEAHELFFPAPGNLQSGKVHLLRKVQAGVPHECGYDGQLPKTAQWNGMYPVHGVRKGLPKKSTVTAKNQYLGSQIKPSSQRTIPKRLSAVFRTSRQGKSAR